MRVLPRIVISVVVTAFAVLLSTLVFNRAIAANDPPDGQSKRSALCEASISAARPEPVRFDRSWHQEFPAVDSQVMVIGRFTTAGGDSFEYDCVVAPALDGQFRVSWWKQAGPKVQ